MSVKPLLVLAWGNLARADDALGLMFAQALRDALSTEQATRVELVEAHQLTPEMALDLAGRERVLMADADLLAPAPFVLRGVVARSDRSTLSHALSPEALLAVYRQLQGQAPPPTTLLRLHAERFGLGLPPSPAARETLGAALQWALRWVDGVEPAVASP